MRIRSLGHSRLRYVGVRMFRVRRELTKEVGWSASSANIAR